MDRYFLQKDDLTYLNKVADTILEIRGIDKKSMGVEEYRQHVGKLFGYSGAVYYNRTINDSPPNLSERSITILTDKLKLFFDTASASDLSRLKFYNEKQFIDRIKKIRQQKIVAVQKDKKTHSVKLTGNRLFNHRLVGEADIVSVREIITNFYQSIGSGDGEAAWQLLSKAYQSKKPYCGNIQEFNKGIVNTRGIKEIHFIKINALSKKLIEATIYYEVLISLYNNSLLTSIQGCTGGELNKLLLNYDLLEERVKKIGGKNFENIPIAKLMEPTASEHIWYNCGIDPTALPSIFNFKNTSTVRRLVTCNCKLIGDGWLINDIQSHSALSVR